MILSSDGQICPTCVSLVYTAASAVIYFKLPMMTGKGATFTVAIGNGIVKSRTDYSVFEPYLKNPGFVSGESGWTLSISPGDSSYGSHSTGAYNDPTDGLLYAFYSQGYPYSGGQQSNYCTQYWSGAPTNCKYRIQYTVYGGFSYAFGMEGTAAANLYINGSQLSNYNSGWLINQFANNLDGSGTPSVQGWQAGYHHPGVNDQTGILVMGNFRLMKYLDPDVTQGYWS